MAGLQVHEGASTPEGNNPRRHPREYTIIDWDVVPENLVEAVAVGYYPYRKPDSFEERISHLISRMFENKKSVEDAVRNGITVTQWPTSPTPDQRRIMKLVIAAEDAFDQLQTAYGSWQSIRRHYPETNVRSDLTALGVAGYRLHLQQSGTVPQHRTRSTLDSDHELERRVEALVRFCNAAVQESPSAAA
ncbi:hypothetical protein [Rhodococcus rhodochrous]|uniref:hypothetical protein n=1 Tax=Rhodococcus rhodochrous TaxID=1829 RepID=UPI0024B9BC8C|nr:hypothetical protein [Rhodococcus rhodochrous]MDJ0401356.1 hypothetical protein [Rhodococcus rhodochrous]